MWDGGVTKKGAGEDIDKRMERVYNKDEAGTVSSTIVAEIAMLLPFKTLRERNRAWGHARSGVSTYEE